MFQTATQICKHYVVTDINICVRNVIVELDKGSRQIELGQLKVSVAKPRRYYLLTRL